MSDAEKPELRAGLTEGGYDPGMFTDADQIPWLDARSRVLGLDGWTTPRSALILTNKHCSNIIQNVDGFIPTSACCVGFYLVLGLSIYVYPTARLKNGEIFEGFRKVPYIMHVKK